MSFDSFPFFHTYDTLVSASYRSSGLGLATVQDLLEGNAYVAVLDISPLPAVLQSSGTKCIYVQTDLRELNQIEDAVKSVIAWTQVTGAELGGVINSAGLGKNERVRHVHLLGHSDT